MIRLQTPDGPKNFILRGVQTQRGKKAVSRASFLDASGIDRVFWDLATTPTGFTATAFPVGASGAGSSAAPIEISTTLITVTPEGASGSPTFLWEKTSGVNEWRISQPTAAATRFTALTVEEFDIQEATFLCTVTDGAGRTTTTSVTATVTNYGDPRGPIP